jgi:hypothetical protein
LRSIFQPAPFPLAKIISNFFSQTACPNYVQNYFAKNENLICHPADTRLGFFTGIFGRADGIKKLKIV